MTLFDEYETKARLVPALLALIPLLIPMALLGIRELLGSGFVGVAITFALASLARQRGRKAERTLWSRWGGAPTTLALSKDSAVNPELRRRARRNLERVTGVTLDDESGPGTPAVEAAVRIAAQKFRDAPEMQMTDRENVAYGFQRNLLGMRPIGITASTLGLAASGLMLVSTNWWAEAPSLGLAIPAMLAETALLWYWMSQVRQERVRDAADEFAVTFLRALAAMNGKEDS